MTEFSLDPAFVKISYTSAYAPHVHMLPTLNWLPTSITGTMGSYVAWDTVPIDAEAMIDDIIALLAAIADPSTTYNLAEIYTKADPDAPARLQAAKVYTTIGTSVSGGVRKAVQATLNLKTTGGNAAKVTFLDYPHGTGQFDKVTPVSFSATFVDLILALAMTSNAWAGRDKTRINTALSVTTTLNEALRKQYRMA